MKITSNSPFLAVVVCCGFSALFAPPTSAQSRTPLWTNYCRVDPENKTPSDKGNHLLCADNNGNVIVAGLPVPVPPYDYVVVKISSSGVSLWTNRFSTPGDREDVAYAVAVDSANNVFVTGYGTYSDTGGDYVTIKYSSAGTPLWTNRYNGPAGSHDLAGAMAVDAAGNVIVTGASFNGVGNWEWATVKYSNSGNLQWARRYGDPGSSDAWAVSVAVDSTNVYVLGYNAVGEFATVAYSALSGTPLWTNNYGPGYFVSRVLEIAADNSGHVFVTGYAPKNSTPPEDNDYVTLAYSSAGVPMWTNFLVGLIFDGVSDGEDRTVGLAVSQGKVFVLGSSSSGFATVAYSTAGALLWTNRFSGDWGSDQPTAIAADSAGNVFVTGLRGDATLNTSYYVTLAYSGAGTLLWTNEMRHDVISPTEIAVDTSGNVFVTGYGTSGGVTLKYSSSVPPPPVLGYQWLNNQLVINWTNSGCALQSSTNGTGPYVDIGGATSPYTNSASGAQQFFRLNCN